MVMCCYVNKISLVTERIGFACFKLIHKCINSAVTLICRLRIDANLFEIPEVDPKGKRGRKSKKGAKIKSFFDMIKDSTTNWIEETITWLCSS